MSENVKIEVFKREAKKREIKEKISEKIQQGKEWVIEHKQAVIILAPIVAKGLTATAKTVSKNSTIRKAEKTKEMYCYDPSLGHYWELKRKLSNKEWLEIDRRRTRGERYADILYDMGVLK